MRREQDEWQRRAELALTRGREDLAKGALAAKARLAEALAREERQLQQLAAALDKQNEDIAKLQAKLADAKAREKSLAARHKSAASRIRLRTSLYDERVTDAFARFEQVERALDEMEGRVEAFDLGRKPGVADELAGLEKDARVEEEFAALEGAARQPAQAGMIGRRMIGLHMGGVFIFILGIIFLVIVAPIWIVAHYLTRWRRSRKLSADDERRSASSTTSRGAWRRGSPRSSACSTPRRRAGARAREPDMWTDSRYRLYRDPDHGVLAGVCAGHRRLISASSASPCASPSCWR